MPSLEARALGGALEAAVLVEEARVEVEDPLADEVEAEVPRLDHAGVDRADRDLVRVAALDRHRPACDVEVVVDERAERLVTLEAHAVEIVRLALVPARRGDEIDDRRDGACDGLDRLDPHLGVVVASTTRTGPPAATA